MCVCVSVCLCVSVCVIVGVYMTCAVGCDQWRVAVEVCALGQ